MVLHILCPECNEDLAEIFPAYEEIKNKFITEISKKDKIYPGKIELKPNIIPGFDFILEALGINKHCCRIHILGDTNFDNIYY